jgi:hypothetical protein
MKKLSLELHVELEIPDDWELVEHSSGIYVLKVGDRLSISTSRRWSPRPMPPTLPGATKTRSSPTRFLTW